MAKKNVFLSDVDIPEIVQDKAEEAFSTIIAEGENTMKKNTDRSQNADRNRNIKNDRVVRQNGKVTKIMAAIAACAAVVVVSTVAVRGLGYTNKGDQEMAENYPDNPGIEGADAPSEMADGSVQETEDGNEEGLLSALDKMFTLHVKAAESNGGQSGETQTAEEQTAQLLAGQQIPLISSDKASAWCLGGDDEEGIVDYCFNMPFTCVGDHIEKVTYSINNGAFQIVQPEGETIIVDGQLYEGELNTGSIGGDYDEENDGLPSRPFETVLYKSFTLDYNRQSDEDTWINICNARPDSMDIFDLLWGDGKSMEDMNNGMQQMLDNTVITCTVQYTDQTSQSVDIKVNTKIMSCAEAGEESKYEDEKSVYFTFELQE